jgi:raffinose/stachyose/melibiose transport system substrate-binding protein
LEEVNDLGSKYSDAGTRLYSYDGNVYALPGISWFEGIYFNKAMFEENNIELPTTFDEYIAVCKQFQELDIKPLAAGLKSWEPMLKNSMAFVTAEYLSQPEGENFCADYREGNATLAGTWDPYIEKWSEMITEGIYTTDMTGIDHDQALEEFATGKAAMFCSGPWDLDAIMEKNPDLEVDMMPFHGTKESVGWLIGGPGCGFAINSASENKEAAMKVLEAISTVEGQEAFWQDNQGGSSYLNGAEFDLPEAYNSVADTLAAGNVYCPWNEWGDASSAHENYGTEMQSYLLGNQDIHTTLANVDAVVKELLEK